MKLHTSLLCLVIASSLLADEVSVPVLQDAYTCDCAPNVTNPNGGITYLYQGRVGNCYCNYFIEWDLSGIEPGAAITSAELYIYCKSFTGTAGGGNPIYFPITESWDENTVTYNTMPSWNDSVSVTSVWPTAYSWHTVDLTSIVQGWIDGSIVNHGVLAHVENTPSTSCPGYFSSSYPVADRQPYLLINGTGLALDQTTWGEVKAQGSL